MKSRILVIILISTLFFAKEEHSFKLKNGSKIIGTIVSENDEIYELDTNMGLIQISKKDIKRFECLFFMNDGNILAGKRVSSSENEIILDTEIGVFKMDKTDYYLWLPKLSNQTYTSLMFLIAILN